MKRFDNIEFYCPEDEIIPTRMRLMVDDKIVVHYYRESGSYVFQFYNVESFDQVKDIAKRIAKIIELQSDDGYTRLVMENMEPIDPTSIKVEFRLRDAG